MTSPSRSFCCWNRCYKMQLRWTAEYPQTHAELKN